MKKLVSEIRKDLVKWIPLNINWIKQASTFLLDKKGINIMDYIQSMIRLDFVADQIALLVIAHMYNIHTGVILSKKYWCTHANQSIKNFEKSHIILVYMGCMKKIRAENVDMTKLLFDLKPECKRKVKETHTQSSEHVSPQRLVPDAEIQDVTPQMPPAACVSPHRLVPDAELEKVTPQMPPAPCVSPHRLVPDAKLKKVTPQTPPAPCVSPHRSVPDAELEKVTPQTPPAPCVSPQRLVPDAELEKQSHSVPVSPQRLVPDAELEKQPHSAPVSPQRLVPSSHPVVLLDHLIVRSAPHSMSGARTAPDSKSAQRSAPHSTSKTGKGRCILKNAICPVCHKKFVSRVKVTEHVREHHTGFKSSCSFCERQYDT